MVKRILITLIAVSGLFTCGKQATENKTTNINVAVNWGTQGAPAAGMIDSIRVTVSSLQRQRGLNLFLILTI